MAKAESHKKHLRFLKILSNSHLRIGEIAHLVINTYLKRLRQGEKWSLDRMLNRARDIYHRALEYPQNFLQHGNLFTNNTHRPALLLEFYYGFAEADVLWAESEAQLLKALTNFLSNPDFARFLTGGVYTEAAVEKSFYLRENYFSFRGKIDFAYPVNNRMAIVDWKIGNAHGTDDSLQLLSYALGAIRQEEFGRSGK